jgi:ribosome hibernation promoting factor
MRIEITGRRLEITDAISSYVDTKCQKLLKFFDGVQEIEVVLDTDRHDHREEFTVDFLIHVVKHDPIISKTVGTDLYSSIDQAIEKCTRQLTDLKEKLRDHH